MPPLFFCKKIKKTSKKSIGKHAQWVYNTDTKSEQEFGRKR